MTTILPCLQKRRSWFAMSVQFNSREFAEYSEAETLKKLGLIIRIVIN